MTITAMTVLLASIGLVAVTAAVLLFWVRPRAGFIVWLLVLFFVPVWIGISAGVFWSAIVAVTGLAIVVNLPWLRIGGIDVLMILFIVLITVLLTLGEVRLAPYVTAVLEWVVPYWWGRIVISRVRGSFIARSIAGIATAAALLAIIEFLTSTNIFVLLPGSGSGYATWSPLQERGGFLRAEGAFGHSIALGAVMAMSSAFVLAAPWRLGYRVVALVLITIATVLTFSRIGLVTLAFTVALSVFLLSELRPRVRVLMAALLVAGTAVATPFLASVFLSAGDEAEGSAGYRTDLFVLLSQVNLVGGAGDWEGLVVDGYYLGYFARSIDSALVSVLLRFGYVPTALLFSVLVMSIVYGLRRGINPATIAVMGQLPSLFAVALITQYGSFLWFVVGLSISWTELRHRARALEAATTTLYGPNTLMWDGSIEYERSTVPHELSEHPLDRRRSLLRGGK